jgi:hypothetical protein
MKVPFHPVCPLVLLAWVGIAAAGSDDKIKAAARKVLAKYDGAVVSVKISGASYFVTDAKPGPKSDFKAELPGTILTANGLTAICNFSTDFESGAASVVAVGTDGPPSKQVYEITEIKLVLKDGSEVLAELLMRDEKLGVAFVAPKQRGMKLAHVSLDNKTPIPEILDDAIFLNRFGEPLKRGAEVGVITVSAVLKQPHMLVVGSSTEGGCAVFDSSGRPLGVTVLRRTRDSKNVPIETSNFTAVVLTAETLRPAMAQALKKWDEKGK